MRRRIPHGLYQTQDQKNTQGRLVLQRLQKNAEAREEEEEDDEVDFLLSRSSTKEINESRFFGETGFTTLSCNSPRIFPLKSTPPATVWGTA
jgi:hypothetical protein